MKISALLFLALAIAGTATAARLQTDDGDYGDSPSFLSQNECLDVNGALLSPAVNCAMTGGVFVDSVTGSEIIYDFVIDGNRSNFTLTLTGTEAFPSDDPPRYAYGAFACDPFSDVQCGPDPTSQLAVGSPTLSLNGMTATFDVTGTNSGANPFVFFVIEPDTLGTVTARITANTTSSTPEPGSLFLFSGAALAVAAYGRRRLAKAL